MIGGPHRSPWTVRHRARCGSPRRRAEEPGLSWPPPWTPPPPCRKRGTKGPSGGGTLARRGPPAVTKEELSVSSAEPRTLTDKNETSTAEQNKTKSHQKAVVSSPGTGSRRDARLQGEDPACEAASSAGFSRRPRSPLCPHQFPVSSACESPAGVGGHPGALGPWVSTKECVRVAPSPLSPLRRKYLKQVLQWSPCVCH